MTDFTDKYLDVLQNVESFIADVEPRPRRVSPDEIVAYLKYIHKSVRFWMKRGGRTGYLDFIDQFIH